MNEFRKQIEKDYGVNEKSLTEGVFYNPPGSNMEFLVKPATFHNKELQKRDLELNFKAKFGRDFFNQETPETRAAVAELYHGTVILGYRFTGSEKVEDLSLDDLKWLFQEYAPLARYIVLFCIDAKNFRIIEEQEAKN
jgi:hypothetical protein